MSVKHHLLLVDDDSAFATALCEQFELHDELSVEVVNTAKNARAAIETGRYDLIILDIELPDHDGRDFCRSLRAGGMDIPIIILSELSSEVDVILGLDAGANDYMVKPFKFGVLLARIRVQLRHLIQTARGAISIGHYILRPNLKLLETPNGDKLRLTEKETEILLYLYRMRETCVSREALLNEVWGYNDGVTTHTIETHIYRLRQKIKAGDQHPLIITDTGGYRLATENESSTA